MMTLDRGTVERLVRQSLGRQFEGNGHAPPAAAPKLVVNVSARHCHVTQEDLERLFEMLAAGAIRPRVAREASATRLSTCRACARKRLPSSVSDTPLACLRRRATPSSSSSSLIAVVTADCEMLSSTAACEIRPDSAATVK